MLNAFRIAQIGSLTIFNMVNGFMDEYEDESGVDLINSINESYNSTYDFYTPTVGYSIDIYTKLMLHLNNNATDSSLTPKTVTNNGVTFSDTIKKFGYAGYFNSSYLTALDSSDWNFGSNNFTIDTWVRFDSFGTFNTILSQWQDTANFMSFQVNSVEGLTFQAYSFLNGTFVLNQGSLSMVTDTWYHVAVVRNGSNWNLYIDGISVANTTSSYIIDDYSGEIRVGYLGYPGYPNHFNGYMDELRVSKGIARWTSNFIVPIEEYNIVETYNMTLLSNAQIAINVPTTARVVIFEEDIDSITLNTDLKAYISRDNGVTFSQVTLEDEGNYITGARILSGVVDISTQPSGSNIKYKLESFGKILNIHGTAISWK